MPPVAFDLIKDVVDLEVWEGEDGPSRAVLLEKVRDCDGLISLLTDRIDAELFDAAPHLRIVSQCAVGTNNIDIAAATQRGIRVTNTPGVLTETTAETAWALLLAASRRVVESDRYVRDGKWRVEWHPLMMLGQDVHNSTVGVFGLGRIGQRFARIALAFGAKVIYHDTQRVESAERELGAEFVSFEDLCRRSDFISVHCDLRPESRHAFNAERFRIMKPNCVLVNTARGPVIDQKALYEALRDRRIAAAGIDVFEKEPVPTDDPLLTLPNVVLVPHIGSASIATRTRMAELVGRNMLAHFTGQPLVSAVNDVPAKPKI